MILRKVYIRSSIFIASLYSTKYIYFISLSVITRIESYAIYVTSSFKISNLTIKSYTIDFYS